MSAESLLTDFVARAPAYTSDSRRARPGDVFVALKGTTRDGHDFVPALVANGVRCVVAAGSVARLGLETAAAGGSVVEVDDPHAAHRLLAKAFRGRFPGQVIAVGGSSGKTTAKEFLAAVLAARFRTAKTDASQNGELGIPLTLEKLRPDVEVGVVEVGIDAPGDMARHAAIVAPDVAVLTSIGEEHLNLLGSVQTVFREETVLFDVTRSRGGMCFAPRDDDWLRKLDGAPGVVLVPSEPAAVEPALACPLKHPYARRNAALATAVALHLGMTPADVVPVLGRLTLPAGRGAERRLASGTLLLLDHYNANPSSLRAGLEAARASADEERAPLVLVLGDMLDLGAESRRAHAAIVDDLGRAGASRIWLVGPEMGRLAPALRGAAGEVRVYPDSAAAALDASDLDAPPAVVLFKGSRGMALERILERVERRREEE